MQGWGKKPWTRPYTLLHSFTCIDATTHTHKCTQTGGKYTQVTRFLHSFPSSRFLSYTNIRPGTCSLLVFCSIFFLTTAWNGFYATFVHQFECFVFVCVSSNLSEHTRRHTHTQLSQTVLRAASLTLLLQENYKLKEAQNSSWLRNFTREKEK